MTGTVRIAAAAGLCALLTLGVSARQERPGGQAFSFKTGVELVSVPVTVTDAGGHSVSGLQREDFVVTEDGQPQTVSQFDAERVPVSLGILLDTSGSMVGEKIVAAQKAIHRFLFDLLGAGDEVFLYRFDSRPALVQPWTSDRRAAGAALGAIRPFGGTAMYDAVAEAVPLAEAGTRRKKALVVISDGNDTTSHTSVTTLQQRVRESGVLVYAIGIDSDGASRGARPAASNEVSPRPVPSPFPGASAAAPRPSTPPAPPAPSASTHRTGAGVNVSVNADALHRLTDDSGGRTEIILAPRDLDPATAGIADELSRQYFLGYVSSRPKDGKWHTIEVRVGRCNCIVRARKGFIAG
jgi:Ca-activated chloride channel family protein